MEVRVHIPFEELVSIVRQLSPAEKAKLQLALTEDQPASTNTRLTELLLNGPVFTEEQIKTMEDTRKSINQWRTKPL